MLSVANDVLYNPKRSFALLLESRPIQQRFKLTFTLTLLFHFWLQLSSSFPLSRKPQGSAPRPRKMASLAGLPSLLVFGPQTEFPPAQVLEDLRAELVGNPQLSALRAAVADLPRIWQSFIDFDPRLDQVPGAEHLGRLVQWVKDGGAFPHQRTDDAPNHFALPVTILLQICQYMRYLGHLGDSPHRQVLQSVRAGGIQGFCVGFLSAIAVAGSKSEADIGSHAAAGLRLAVCIGAYVDQDGISSGEPKGTACVAIRWREGSADDKAAVNTMIRSYPGVSAGSN